MRAKTTVMIKAGGMGDLLMLTPALRAYRKSFPEERIVFFVGASNRDALRTNPHIDQLEILDDWQIFRGSLPQRAREAGRLVAAIRKVEPERLFVFHRDWRWNVVAWLAGGRERYGFRRDLNGRFLTHAIASSREEHEIEKYLNVVSQRPGLQRDGSAMDLPAGEGDVSTVDRLLQGWLDGPLVAISPGGAANVKEDMDLRRWPLSRFEELLRRILEHTAVKLVLLGGSGDRAATQALRLDEERVLDLAGRTSIPQTAEVLRRCTLLVTHDSGPMHLGAAAAIPVVALFGPTDLVEKVPVTHGLSRALWRGQELPCSPCYDNGRYPACPIDKQCMRAIDVAIVFRAVKEILDTVAVRS